MGSIINHIYLLASNHVHWHVRVHNIFSSFLKFFILLEISFWIWQKRPRTLFEGMTCCHKEWWKISQEKGPKCLQIRPQEMLWGISTVLSWWSSYLTQPIRRRKSVHVLGLLVPGEEIGISDKNKASYTQSFWWCPLSLLLSMPHIFLRVSFNLF